MEDLDTTAQLIVDGALLECWSWKDRPELYSGRHRTTGLSVQVACTLSGALAWVCDPHDGRVHDTEALRRCGLLEVPPQDLPDGAQPPLHVGDKGYTGLGMITPRREPANLPLHPRRQDLQPGRQPDPLQDRKSHRQHQDLEGPAHRLQNFERLDRLRFILGRDNLCGNGRPGGVTFMSDVIVAAIIGAVGTVGATAITLIPSIRKKEEGGQSATVKDSKNVNIKQSKHTHVTNNYAYSQSSSTDDEVGYIFILLIAFLLFVVGIGMFGRPVMWGLALMDTLFVFVVLTLAVRGNFTIRKWYLAAYVSSAVLVWGAVNQIDNSNIFKTLTEAVSSGSLGHKMMSVIQAKYVGHGALLVFFAVAFSVFLTVISGGMLIKKFYNAPEWVDEKGGRECVICLIGVVLLFALCFGGGYFDSWIMRANSEGVALLSG